MNTHQSNCARFYLQLTSLKTDQNLCMLFGVDGFASQSRILYWEIRDFNLTNKSVSIPYMTFFLKRKSNTFCKPTLDKKHVFLKYFY